MKINPTHIDKLYGAASSDGAAAASRDEHRQSAVGRDSLVLSDAARKHSETDVAVRTVVDDATKPTSAERLLRYKEQIQSGTYRARAEDIAEAMLTGRKGGVES